VIFPDLEQAVMSCFINIVILLLPQVVSIKVS
jgi:hypothetical protein